MEVNTDLYCSEINNSDNHLEISNIKNPTLGQSEQLVKTLYFKQAVWIRRWNPTTASKSNRIKDWPTILATKGLTGVALWGESEESILRRQIEPGAENKAETTGNPNQEYHWFHKKEKCPSKIFNKKKKNQKVDDDDENILWCIRRKNRNLYAWCKWIWSTKKKSWHNET